MKSTCFRWVSLGVMVLALVAAGSSVEAKSLDKATAAFCTDLASYAKSVNNLYALTPSDTLADYQNAQKATIAEASNDVDVASAAALADYVDISTTVCTYDVE